jgi:hypothetical protein
MPPSASPRWASSMAACRKVSMRVFDQQYWELSVNWKPVTA